MIIFVIPAYNESANIKVLLSNTKEAMDRQGLSYKIIIVNDGSTDNTMDIIEPFKKDTPIIVESYYPNKGVGEAFRIGLKKAADIAADTDIIVTKEADNTSDIDILNKMVSKVREGYSLVLASCYAEEGKVVGTTFSRKILSKCANFILKVLIPIKGVNTYSSFYRTYNAKALKSLYNAYGNSLIRESGFECMIELLIKFSRFKEFKITEVPMVLDGSQRLGKSKMRIFKTIKGFLKVILKQGLVYNLGTIFTKR